MGTETSVRLAFIHARMVSRWSSRSLFRSLIIMVKSLLQSIDRAFGSCVGARRVRDEAHQKVRGRAPTLPVPSEQTPTGRNALGVLRFGFGVPQGSFGAWMAKLHVQREVLVAERCPWGAVLSRLLSEAPPFLLALRLVSNPRANDWMP